MTIEDNCYMYQMLAEICTTRQSIDDPNFSPKQIFQTIASSYNNESIHIKLQDDINDVDGIEEIDINNISRIMITRDCEYLQ